MCLLSMYMKVQIYPYLYQYLLLFVFFIIAILVSMKVKSLSRVRLLATPWTAAHQAPLSMGFSRQEYWSGLPLPSLSICEEVSNYGLTYISLMNNHVKHLFMCLLAILYLLWEKMFIPFLCPSHYFIFLLLCCKSSSYVMGINLVWDV